ncbi:MAG: hypothetical protein IJ039_09670, partial [Clostridia bacterium]|nr:hypothetical protein [Clostridia bacterium]
FLLVIFRNLIIHQSKQPLNTFSVKSGCFFTFWAFLVCQPLFSCIQKTVGSGGAPKCVSYAQLNYPSKARNNKKPSPLFGGEGGNRVDG